jgi:hypothetical protein
MQSVNHGIHESKKFIRDNINVKFSLVEREDDKSRTNRKLQHFFSKKFSDTSTQKIYEIILSHASLAEKASVGAGLLLLSSFVSGMKQTDLSSKSRLSRSEMLKTMMSFGISNNIYEMMSYVLGIATQNSRIAIVKSSGSAAFIEESVGYDFAVNSLLSNTRRELSNVKMICIDGFVESVSELHRVLEQLAESKEQCVLVSRGMSQDVVHTIKVNNDRCTLQLYPFLSPFDLENANMLVDIATVAGCDVVSSLRGDLISSIDIKEMKSVDHVSILNTKIIVKNKASNLRIKEHIKTLTSKIEERPELTDVLTRRIRLLSASCITVSLPDDMNFNSSSQQVDECIRYISSVMNRTYNSVAAATLYTDALNMTLEDIGEIIV